MLKVANSVISASRITGVLPVVNGGTGVTTSTGTGNTVLSATPTLSGNVSLSTGNLVIGTADKGIDFSANASAPGMTSELFNDYEEGTWTPTDSSGASLVLTINSSSYTKVGRLVTCTADITYPSTASTASAVLTLPFVMASGPDYSQMGPPIRNNASLSIQVFGLNNTTPSTFLMLIIGQFTTYATNVQLTGARLQFTYTYQSA